MHERATGLNIFKGMKSVLDGFNVQWSKMCSVTTDGAPAMVGTDTGLVAQVKLHLTKLVFEVMLSICTTVLFTKKHFVVVS